MISAEKARIESDKKFLIEYSEQIQYIENKIQTLVDVGMRSVYIDNDVSWVGEKVEQTKRLIHHFGDLGFSIKIVGSSGMSMSEWTNNCSGIEISW